MVSSLPAHNRVTQQQTYLPQRPSHAPQQKVYSPDARIFAVDRHNSPPTFRPSSKPPKDNQPKFDGKQINWPMFIQSFKIHIQDTCFSDAERQQPLRTSLKTNCQKNLGEVLLKPGVYPFVLKELHWKIGNPRIISTAYSSSLLKLSSFKDSDHESL